MSQKLENLLIDVSSKDDKIRMRALQKLLKITDEKVDWPEEHYSELTKKIKHENSFQRSIGMMLFCNLAKSDVKRVRKILPEVLKLIDDEKFVTSRQTIQNLWKIAVSDTKAYSQIDQKLTKKYKTCTKENHPNLIRQDIVKTLYTMSKTMADKALKQKIVNLIESEKDEKYRKNYLQIIK